MYQCIIPPRVFLSTGVGLLIFSLVLGWISFSVPDWLEYYERNSKNILAKNLTEESVSQDDPLIDLTKFGLWRKCVYSINTNDFICAIWRNNIPTFVRITQVLITFGLSVESLSLLCTIIGFMSRRIFIASVLVSSLFAFLSFIFTTIGVTVFATESLVFVDRLRLSNNENPRRWGMWLFIPNLVLSFMASVCFILASLSDWCDFQSMRATGILSHAADKYGGSVFKAPSDSTTNITSTTKKQQYAQQQQTTMQDYPNTCYQINGQNNTQNQLGYPPPPSYGAPMHQTTTVGTHNTGFFGYSRPPSPTYPHLNLESYNNRHHMNDSSDVEESSRASVSRRHSRSCRHSSRRSRSNSPRDRTTSGNNNKQDKNTKQPQFIPIPVPYYQPPTQSLPMPQTATTTQTSFNTLTNNNTNANANTINQPMSYFIQQPKQQFIEEIVQPTNKVPQILSYGSEKPQVLISNPTQPVYTIAYRANNNGNMLPSNFLTGPAATTYVTATRDQIAELNSFNDDSDNEGKNFPSLPKQSNLKKIKGNEVWTWRKL